VAAVVARRVVRRHRPVVVSSEVVDKPHPGDGPSGGVQAGEDADDRSGMVPVDHQLSCVDLSVEADVRQLQVPQLGQRDRATGVVAEVHPGAQLRAETPH